MKIIISPAKIMNEKVDIKPVSQPIFLNEALKIYGFLKSQDEKTLTRIWECNEKIVKENLVRLERYDLLNNTMPAIFVYNGLQFKKMNPEGFDRETLSYVNSHLVILSGLYGCLRPLDGINPYRLMMMADIKLQEGNLYEFWSDKIYKELTKDEKVILNLASKEYSDVIMPYLKPDITFINVSFLSKNKKGEFINKSTEAKTCRGAMVAYLANLKTDDINDVKNFGCYGYRFDEFLSDSLNFVFIKE